jgi:hypothetical protein
MKFALIMQNLSHRDPQSSSSGAGAPVRRPFLPSKFIFFIENGRLLYYFRFFDGIPVAPRAEEPVRSLIQKGETHA